MRGAGRTPAPGSPIERAAPDDLAMRAIAARSTVAPQLGAVLLLDARPDFDLAAAERLLAERIRTVPAVP